MQRMVPVNDGQISFELLQEGAGPELLYLHGIWDGVEQNPLVAALARRYTVLAPRLPGFGKSSGERHLHDVHDATYALLDLLDAIGFQGGPLVGHCLGGMFAAELAAVQPQRFNRLVLIDPFGLWNDAYPPIDFFAAGPDDLAVRLHGHARELVAAGATPAAAGDQSDEARIERALERAKALSGAARFLWPIPDRGLAKRLHRISAPTLLVWGRDDGVLPARLGEDFQRAIRGSRLEVVDDAAHLPHLQQPEQVAEMVTAFLS